MGWTVGSEDTIARLAALKLEGGTSPFSSQVAAEWTRNGTLESHIQVLRDHYRRKRDLMLRELENNMPDGVRWTRPQGGFFIWVTLPDDVDSVQLARRLGDQGVFVSAGPGFYHTDRGHHEFRLSYSYPTDEEISKGISIVGNEIRASQS